MFNMELSVEVLELFIIKLSTVVSDDDLREAESRGDGLLNKFSGLGLDDLSYRLSFQPFGEVIDSHEHELPLCWGRREGSEDVDPPLGK